MPSYRTRYFRDNLQLLITRTERVSIGAVFQNQINVPCQKCGAAVDVRCPNSCGRLSGVPRQSVPKMSDPVPNFADGVEAFLDYIGTIAVARAECALMGSPYALALRDNRQNSYRSELNHAYLDCPVCTTGAALPCLGPIKVGPFGVHDMRSSRVQQYYNALLRLAAQSLPWEPDVPF